MRFAPATSPQLFDDLGMLAKLFGTKEHNRLYFSQVGKLVKEIEMLDYGLDYGLYLHFEMNLTLPKILQLTQAASKRFDLARNFYASKIVLRDPHSKENVIYVPRIAPPTSRLEPAINAIRERLGIESAADGRMAFIKFDAVMQEVLTREPGFHDMPPLPAFFGGALELPVIISRDATGHGNMQLTTIAVRLPWQSQSAEVLYPFGLGSCDDGKASTLKLLGPNREAINSLVQARRSGTLAEYEVRGTSIKVKPHLYFVDDVSALRHGQLLANAGFCSCPREVALRKVPTDRRPTTIAEMVELVEGPCAPCQSPTAYEMCVLGHRRVEGKLVPCTASGCTFAHNASIAEAEESAMLATEAEHLAAVKQGVKGAKQRYSKWRMNHANSHGNVQPGKEGEGIFDHDMLDQILDALHFVELNLPKIPWKHGVLNNASDEAREEISDWLKEVGYPLDCRRKDAGRVRAQTWFTGEAWAAFCKGLKNSPGGPIAIAKIIPIIARDLQARGVNSGSGVAGSAVAAAASGGQGVAGGRGGGSKGGGGRGRGRGAFAARSGAVERPGEATEPAHEPTALERAADPADLAIIRELFGSRAQTIINICLGFDGYFNYYYPYKESIPLDASAEVTDAHALLICQTGIDLHEINERVTIREGKSFLSHAAWGKSVRDIRAVKDVWAFCLSALELHNAKVKRVAESGGARRIVTGAEGLARKPMRGKEGPAQLVATKNATSTTASRSILQKCLAGKALRTGYGIEDLSVSGIASRRRERVFGETGSGRSKGLSTGIKIEKLGAEYEPRNDTVLRALVRMLAETAAGTAEGVGA